MFELKKKEDFPTPKIFTTLRYYLIQMTGILIDKKFIFYESSIISNYM